MINPTKATQILNELKKLQKICIESPFKDNDARGDFYKLTYDVLDNFYKGYFALELAVFMNEGKVSFSPELMPYQENFDRFIEIVRHPILVRSHLGNLNRSVIIDIWSAFEVVLTSIAEACFEQTEKNDLLLREYVDVEKLLKTCNCDEKIQLKLKEKFVKKHLSHVSINHKYGKLFKRFKKKYKRDIENDRKFLEFWGKLRNTVHGNYIYTGNDFEYKFKGYHFIFENGKTVKHDDFENDPYFIMNMIDEIILIFTEIISHLDEFVFIPYLDVEAEKFEL
ncbi:MAG: hypothetical protein GC192_20010 [Bacteroidetes bacterium]|nr:hypothetical protein [Bacteroidota bacterium]